MSLVSDPNSGRPLLKPLSESSGGGSALGDFDLATEVAALAELLAEVVELAADRAVFPSRLQVLADLATEHASVRHALAAQQTAP